MTKPFSIDFQSEGSRLTAHHHKPEGDGPFPVIVMAHGFSAVMEQLQPQIDRFVAADLAVLAFDHPGFGLSDGPVRSEVDPARHIAAWRDAISLAGRIDANDANRVGIWGSSLSGGHVLKIGALDPRVRAIVSQAPLVDGWALSADRPDAEARAMMLAGERAARGRGAEPTYLPVISPDENAMCVLPGAAAWEFFGADPAESWENRVTLSSIENIRGYAPGFWAARINRPVLMIVATVDLVTPTAHARAAFDRIKSEKRLVEIEGGHFEVYRNDGFEIAMGAAIDWFKAHL
jgi:uncharacterized protein